MDWDEYADTVVVCAAPHGCVEVRSAPLTHVNGPFPCQKSHAIYVVVLHDPEAAHNLRSRFHAGPQQVAATGWPASISLSGSGEQLPGVAIVGAADDMAQILCRLCESPLLMAWRSASRSVLCCGSGRQRFTGWSSRWVGDSQAGAANHNQLRYDHKPTTFTSLQEGTRDESARAIRPGGVPDSDTDVSNKNRGSDFYRVFVQWIRMGLDRPGQ